MSMNCNKVCQVIQSYEATEVTKIQVQIIIGFTVGICFAWTCILIKCKGLLILPLHQISCMVPCSSNIIGTNENQRRIE
jgi:hypothetical protein